MACSWEVYRRTPNIASNGLVYDLTQMFEDEKAIIEYLTLSFVLQPHCKNKSESKSNACPY